MGLWRALSELNEPAWDSRLVRCFGPSERPPKIAEGALIPNRDAERAAEESGGELSAQLIDHLKKSDMANEAKCLLDGSGWPEPLRLAEVASAPAARVSIAEAGLSSSVSSRSQLDRPWGQPPRAGDTEAPSTVRSGSAR